jgi:hypothetical protein
MDKDGVTEDPKEIQGTRHRLGLAHPRNALGKLINGAIVWTAAIQRHHVSQETSDVLCKGGEIARPRRVRHQGLTGLSQT